MLLTINQWPSRVVVPAPSHARGRTLRIERLTWALNINMAETVSMEKQSSHLDIPLVDNTAFIIRTDLYKVCHLPVHKCNLC